MGATRPRLQSCTKGRASAGVLLGKPVCKAVRLGTVAGAWRCSAAAWQPNSHLLDPISGLLLGENLLEKLDGGWAALDSHQITAARLSSQLQLIPRSARVPCLRRRTRPNPSTVLQRNMYTLSRVHTVPEVHRSLDDSAQLFPRARSYIPIVDSDEHLHSTRCWWVPRSAGPTHASHQLRIKGR